MSLVDMSLVDDEDRTRRRAHAMELADRAARELAEEAPEASEARRCAREEERAVAAVMAARRFLDAGGALDLLLWETLTASQQAAYVAAGRARQQDQAEAVARALSTLRETPREVDPLRRATATALQEARGI